MYNEPVMTMIETSRLRLPLMSEPFLEACIRDDLQAAGTELGLSVPHTLLDRNDLLRFRLTQLQSDPTYYPFALRAIMRRDTNEMVGIISFHAPPDSADLAANGLKGLELGYSVFEPYRRRGYVQEASLGLIKWAKENHGVETFIVSISPKNNASTALAKKLGYVKVAEQIDQVDGLEEIYVLEGRALDSALNLLEYTPDN